MQRYKGRQAWVYLPTEEDLREWKADAAKFGTPLSDYIFEMVQRGRRASGGIPYISDDAGDCSKFIERIHILEEKLRNQSLLKDKVQQALDEYKAQSSTQYHLFPDLIKVLRTDKSLSNDDIISWLNLKPDDSDEIRNLFKLLDLLSDWKLINSNARGEWKWIR